MRNGNPTTVPATAEALRALFAAEGFSPGPPPGLPAEVLMIDLHANRGRRCPRCRKRLAAEPWSDGVCHRLLCGCTACAFGEEA